ncbi:MAG: glycine--tRNA ligase subunit beta [Halanaerobium sp.]|nr:glycine--tRNA ligase subunit beta [Halanaerobium sp.]
MSRDLLLEIGTEEIPAGFFPEALNDLADNMSKYLENERLEFADIETYGTPRRLAVIVRRLAEEQPDLEEEVRGPKAEIAFDAEGKPTKAGSGFARGQGVEPGELNIRDTEKGRYVFATRREAGSPARELLPEIIKRAVTDLSFPKMMRWGDENLRFARPIHWILALFGGEQVKLELAGVESSNYTRGHRFLSPEPFPVKDADSYLGELEEKQVIADHQRRESLIREQVEELAGEVGGAVDLSGGLLHEVNFLVEYPTALRGSFKEEYLNLPEEVLVTSMKKHQRYFPLIDKDSGELLPYFITVRNGQEGHLEKVKKGNQWVLRARLEDAIFFYQEDQKSTLEEKVPALQEIIFQQKLGTMADKVGRLTSLAGVIARHFGLAEDKLHLVTRAAKLAKADLVTEMVGEFPDLQGTMGREYALLNGEEQEVAAAIFEHYLPRYADDELPKTITGTVVSLADKFDTLAGFFGLGMIPTGSQDPYALRRQTQGVLRILLEKQIPVSLHKLINEALNIYQVDFPKTREESITSLLDFFGARLKKLGEDEGIRYDVMEAIISAGFDDPADAMARARALEELRGDQEFLSMVTGYKRAVNLAEKGDGNHIVNPDYFEEDCEEELWKRLQEVRSELTDLAGYPAVFRTFASLRPYIDAFLDGVMVMVEDEQVRLNRLALLKEIAETMERYADLSLLVIEGD